MLTNVTGLPMSMIAGEVGAILPALGMLALLVCCVAVSASVVARQNGSEREMVNKQHELIQAQQRALKALHDEIAAKDGLIKR